MKIGAVLPTVGPCARGPQAAETQRVIAQHVEALGFDSLWVPDHIFVPTKMKQPYPYTESGEWPLPLDTPYLEALASLAFLSGVTSCIRLGTSVLVLPHRNPIIAAKMIATIDVLSGGRTILGAGVGYLEEEIALLGASFKDRGALSDEYAKAMRELWESPDPVFAGQFVSFKDIKCEPKPLQSPLPIWFGGHSRRMIRRTVALGDGFIFAASSVETFLTQQAILEEETTLAGRVPESITKVLLLSSATSAEAALLEIEQYRKLEADHFIVYLASWGSSLNDYLSAAVFFADRVGLVPANPLVLPQQRQN